jgi:hypothetical protein
VKPTGPEIGCPPWFDFPELHRGIPLARITKLIHFAGGNSMHRDSF